MSPRTQPVRKGIILAVLAVLFVMLLSLPSAGPVASLEAGPTLRALKLNGSNAYLEVDRGAALGDLDAITIEAWVYRRNQGNCETIVGGNFVEAFWFGFCDTQLRFYPRGLDSWVDGTSLVPHLVWTHVAVTYDGATVRFYINGQLDREVSSPGGLAAATSPIGIGVDIATRNVGYDNYFSGMLDEVRIWGIARSPADIQADMFREIGDSGGLLGVWRMNGSPIDLLGLNHTNEKGDVRYDTGGVLPFGLHIPVTENIPDIDGQCEPAEYNIAERVGLRRGEPTIYLQHDEENLYVCIVGLWQDSGGNDEVIVAIDHNLSRDSLAQSTDYRYILTREGATRAERGNGSGGFTAVTPPSGSWEAVAHVELEFYWRAEFRISRGVPEAWAETIGLDIVAKGEPPANHFPAGAVENSPVTWSPAIIRDGDPAVAPIHRLSGHVRDTNEEGIPGVTVRLYSANGGVGGSLLYTAATDENGHYAFEYHGYAPNWFRVVEEDPRGAYSVSAEAGSDGRADSLNVLVYPGAQAGKTYTPGLFVDSIGSTFSRSLNRHYLIIYGDPVQPSDLTQLVDMKRLEGFQVEWVSVETIESTVTGPDRQTKIRNWLKSRWQAYRPNPVYALLIGHGRIIPTPDYGTRLEHPELYPGDPGYVPIVRTDWFYADLDSNWDLDGDRHVAECLKHDDDNNPICQNPDDPIYHEGPFGTSPDRHDDWVPEIAIGRIGLVTGAEVRSALATSVAAESSGSLDKRKGLVAGAFWSYENQPWNAATGDYATEGWDGIQPYGDDSAEGFESGLRPILEEHLSSFTTLYNSTKPDNPTALSPTRFEPDIPLTFANFENFWQNEAFGLANLAGHGDWHGVYIGEVWTRDWDRPGVINNPADPSTCPDPPCLELEGQNHGFMIHHAFEPTGGEIAPVIYAQSCGTGEVGYYCDFSTSPPVCTPGRYAIASTLPMRGAAAVWMGASMTHTTGRTEELQQRFNHDLLGTPLLVGDALWKNNQWVASISRRPDWRTVNMMVNGDPAYSYWGNPLDMQAYWPQAGRDWFGSSASPAGGPSAGLRLWTSPEGESSQPSSIDRHGNIYTVYIDSIVVRAPDGTIIDSQSLDIEGLPQSPPLITTDGVYVVTHHETIALDRELNIRETISHVAPGLSGEATVGPDGALWLPFVNNVVRYTPGNWQVLESTYWPVSRVVLTASGAAVWAKADGSVSSYHQDRYGNVTERVILPPEGPRVEYLVAAPSNRIIAARGNTILSINEQTGGLVWSFDTGAAVFAAPAVGPTGTIFATNRGGEVVALNNSGSLLWRRGLGDEIFTTPAVDDARVYVSAGTYLYALDIASGEVLWRTKHGEERAFSKSSPVIGSNRTIYITNGDGQVVAIGPSLWHIAPSDLEVEAITGGVTARWRDNSSGESGFRIERCADGECVFVASAPANAESVTINQMPVGGLFSYRIQAVGALSQSRAATAASESSDFIYSPVVEVLPPLPAIPANLTATTRSSQAIDLSWSYAGDRDLLLGFDIYRATTVAGPYQLVGVAHSDDTSYRDVALEPSTTYYYKVAAVNAAGPSPQAGPKDATTKPQSLPAPTQLRGEYGDGAVELSWQDNATTESGYLIEREVPGGVFDAVALLPANTTSYTDDYLLVDGVTQYRVRAVSNTADSPAAETGVSIGGPAGQLFLPIVRR